MPKKIIRHEKIPDGKQRNRVYKNRSEGLLKKVNELSILCGIDVAVVVHERDENNATLWPSPEIYRERMQKFLNFSKIERERKMVTHDKYLDQRVVDESRDLFKAQRMNEVLEGQLVADDLTNGKSSYEILDLIHMNNMNLLADDMLGKIEKIIYDHQLASEQEQQHPNPTSLVMPPPVPNLSPLEDLLSWSDIWSADQPAASAQGDLGGFVGFKAMPDYGGASSSTSTPAPGKN